MSRGGWYESGVATLARNERRKALEEQAKRDDRRVAAAEAGRGRRSI